MIDHQRRHLDDAVNQRGYRHLLPARRFDIDACEGLGPVLKLWVDLQNNVVLLQGGVNGRNNTLAEGVVERVVDHVGQDTVTRGDIALDRDVEHRRGIELISGDVDDSGDGPKLVEEFGRPLAELAGVGVVHGVLKLRLVQARADRNVLSSLHIKRDALDPGEVGAQPRDHLVDRLALAMGLELNEYTAVVERVEATTGTHRRTYGVDGRIPHDDVEQSLLAFGHRRERNVLRRLRLAKDQSRVLLRKEALGNDHVEIPGQRDGAEHYHQRGEAVPQHDFEPCHIEVEQAIETPLRQAIEPSVLFALRLEQVCAHHRRERPRDHQ